MLHCTDVSEVFVFDQNCSHEQFNTPLYFSLMNYFEACVMRNVSMDSANRRIERVEECEEGKECWRRERHRETEKCWRENGAKFVGEITLTSSSHVQFPMNVPNFHYLFASYSRTIWHRHVLMIIMVMIMRLLSFNQMKLQGR